MIDRSPTNATTPEEQVGTTLFPMEPTGDTLTSRTVSEVAQRLHVRGDLKGLNMDSLAAVKATVEIVLQELA